MSMFPPPFITRPSTNNNNGSKRRFLTASVAVITGAIVLYFSPSQRVQGSTTTNGGSTKHSATLSDHATVAVQTSHSTSNSSSTTTGSSSKNTTEEEVVRTQPLVGNGTTTTTTTTQIITGDKGVEKKTTNSSSSSSLLIARAEAALSELGNSTFPSFVGHHLIPSARSISEHGFPVSWKNACTMMASSGLPPPSSSSSTETDNDLPHRRRRPLKLAFLGGSSTARGAKNCNNAKGSRLGGRYTNVLESELVHDLGRDLSRKHFEILNLAHGSTDSYWSSLTLDEVLPLSGRTKATKNTTTITSNATAPTDTDDDETEDMVVVWEFAINDALGGGTGMPKRTADQMERMLDLWLWRLGRLFAPARPPPILLLYLWDSGLAGQMVVGQSAFDAGASVVEYYREKAGWDISVVNVGGAVNGTMVDKGPGELLDDTHHPGCAGVRLISAMLRKLIYTDLVNCHETFLQSKNSNLKATGDWHKGQKESKTKAQDTSLPPWSQQPKSQIYHDRKHNLYDALLGPKTRIGSLMQWTPKAGESLLTLAADGDSDKDGQNNIVLEALHGSKASATRRDRKIAYALPICPETTSFVIQEPHLEWLGLGLGGGNYQRNTFSGKIQVSIDGVQVNTTRTAAWQEDQRGLEYDTMFVHHWIRVSNVFIENNTSTRRNIAIGNGGSEERHGQYRLKVCNQASEQARCPFDNATSVDQACQLWRRLNGVEDCFFENTGTVQNACLKWYKSPEGVELRQKHGNWVGDWGQGQPQLNWIIGVMVENS